MHIVSDQLPQERAVHQNLSCLLSIFLIIIISLAILAGTSLRTILHQRTSSPKIGFTKITKSHDLIDAKIILTLCGSTCRSLIPINRQQIGSLAEICCRFISAFLIRKAWQIQLGIGIEISIHIRHTTKILHHFLMPPCTEEIELTLYQFFSSALPVTNLSIFCKPRLHFLMQYHAWFQIPWSNLLVEVEAPSRFNQLPVDSHARKLPKST